MSNQPGSRDLHVDQYLTGVSIGYSNAEYISDRVFPLLPVNKQSDIIPQYTQSAWFRNEMALRAIGTASRQTGWGVDNTMTYFCPRYSLSHPIPDELRDNADAVWNLDLDTTEFLTDKAMMAREVDFATNFMKTSLWGTDVAGTTNFVKWSDYANSTPLVDLTTYYDAVEALIGRGPNTLVLGKPVWSVLKWHPDLLDTIKYTERAIPGTDLLAAAIDLPKVLVGKAIYTASAEGTAETSVTYARIWGKDALLLYVPDRPSLMRPAAGYTIVWQRVAAALQYMKRWREEKIESDILEVNGYWVHKLTAKNAGAFLHNAVA